jgi:hypothetical protein
MIWDRLLFPAWAMLSALWAGGVLTVRPIKSRRDIIAAIAIILPPATTLFAAAWIVKWFLERY